MSEPIPIAVTDQIVRQQERINQLETAMSAIKAESAVVFGVEYHGFELWNRLDNINQITKNVAAMPNVN